MRRTMLLCAPLVVVALLAGCDQGGNDLGSGFKKDAGSDTQTDNGSGHGSDSTTGPDQTTTPDHTTGQHGSGDSCLTGSWQPSDLSAAGLDSFASMGGSYDFTLKFAGGTVSLDFSVSIPSTYSQAESISVTAKGSYSTSGSSITVSDWTTTTKINGQVQSDADYYGFGNNIENGTSTYSCSGNTLTLDGTDFSRK